MENITHVGMDVHKETIVVAYSRNPGVAQMLGDYPNTELGIKRLLRGLSGLGHRSEIKTCYEAGPCGYALKRVMDKQGWECQVVAPSLIPVQSGNRIKTDARDAKKLAVLYSSNQLSFVTVPKAEQEAVRNLVRCRQDVQNDLKRVRQRLNHFLIRSGHSYGKGRWSKLHLSWIRQLKFVHASDQTTLEQYLSQQDYLQLQLKAVDQSIGGIATSEPYRKQVETLCGFRGIKTLTAMILLSEIVDFKRFANAPELMSYLGLVPSEYSSGGRISRGRITKTGNSHVRKALVEAAWHQRHRAVMSEAMKKSLEKLPDRSRAIALKSMGRLHKKYQQLLMRGKEKQKIVVAVAREMVGFVWHSMVSLEN